MNDVTNNLAPILPQLSSAIDSMGNAASNINASSSALQGDNQDATLSAILSAVNDANNNLAPIISSMNDVTNNLAPILPQLSTAIDSMGNAASNIDASSSAVQGDGFVPGEDDLHSLSVHIRKIGTSTDVSGLYASLSSIHASLALLISQQAINPIAQVNAASNNIALTTPIANGDPLTSSQLALYNGSLASAQTAISLAKNPNSQSSTNTVNAMTAVSNAMTDFNTLVNQWHAHNYAGPTTTPSAASISAALSQLNAALAYLLNSQQQPV